MVGLAMCIMMSVCVSVRAGLRYGNELGGKLCGVGGWRFCKMTAGNGRTVVCVCVCVLLCDF